MNINMSVFTGDQGWLIFGMVFLLLSMLAMMAAVSIYGFRELKRRRKAYHKISDFLREKTSLKNGILIVPHQDMDFSLRFYGRRKQTPDGFWISATCHAPGFFKISKEGALERLFKRFRLSTEIQTGDPAFDDACYISSDTAQFAFTYLKSVLHRKRIQKLFEMGFKEIKLDDKGLSINFAPVTRVAEKDPSFLMDALNCMAELAGNIPKETLESLAPVSVAWKVKRGLVFGLIGIAVLTAIITGIWTHDLCLPFDCEARVIYPAACGVV